MRWLCDKSLASSPALPPGRVPHVRGLSRTWVEHDLFPMLSPPVCTYLQEKKKEGFAHLVQPMYAKGPRTWGTRPGSKAWWKAGKAEGEIIANLPVP
jgi:hypothetical protein